MNDPISKTATHWKDSLTMQPFKFTCPDCDYQLEAEASSVGCLVECPNCSEELVVPVYNPSAMTLPAAKHSKHFPPHPPVEQSEEASDSAQVTEAQSILQDEVVQASPEDEPQKVPDHEGKMVHVAALTPAIKLEVVRWAFRRIENPTAWLPHERKEGRFTYAAKRGSDGFEPVGYDDPKASKYSLLGAVLLELKIQHATVAAQGREEFLDHEIMDMAREVLTQASVALEDGSDPLGKLDHKLTLSVLRQLEGVYLSECEHLDDMMESARLPGVTMAELIQRAEKGELVTSNEVLSVLYHEVHLLNRRVEELEDIIKTRLS